MTVDQLMRETEALSFEEKGQLAAYLVQMRNRKDPEYLAEMQARIEDKDTSHWLKPDEVKGEAPQVNIFVAWRWDSW